jgi:GntR family transcriptional regulator, transcriptional repressor for pyruvate dehydrogenase complex
MTISYNAISKETFPSQIAKEIRSAILDGRLKIDQRLPSEEDLAVEFNVSRPTIREALKRLAAQNLIRSRRGPSGGNFVNGPSIAEAKNNLAAVTTMLVSVGDISIEAITQARMELESMCVRIAAAERTEDDLRRMTAEIDVQKNIELTDVEFCATDVRFHRILVDATHNDLLQFLMTAAVEALQPISNLITFRTRDRREIIGHHQRIVDHLSRHDGEGAASVIVEQTLYLREHYLRAAARRASQ